MQAEPRPDAGLTMVPARCFNSQRQRVATDHIVIFHNKVVTFTMNTFNMHNVTLRSEIIRGTVYVRYSDEGGVAVFYPLNIANYQASDARVYHGTMAGRPIVVWEEIAENVPRRAGIIEYRGRGLFPVCDGLIPAPPPDRDPLARE